VSDRPADDKEYAVEPWQPEQDRRRLAALGKLLEEVGELGAIAARCVIQGIEERDPDTGEPNVLALEKEIADVRAAMNVAVDVLELSNTSILDRQIRKETHLRRWITKLTLS
jgi:hypothetical protein